MKGLAVNIVEFLKSLTFIDYVLYFAVLVLLILIISLIYLLKTTSIEEEEQINEENENFDIKETMEQIAQSKPSNIDLTQYEQEQEENAIISYDELVNSIKKKELNYESNELIDDKISVKKIDLNAMLKEQEEKKNTIRVISLSHEEEFLNALKQLQKELN